MKACILHACAALPLVVLAPCALAQGTQAQSTQAQSTPSQSASPQSIAVGEPDPSAPHPPARPAPRPQPQIDAVFKAWDRDGNGALSKDEFESGYANLRRAGELQGRLRHQFGVVDANDNGAVDANEYGNLLLVRQAGKSAPPLSAFDANSNQRLEFAEYVALVRRMSARPAASPAAPEPKP
jgi:hypothetical protein